MWIGLAAVVFAGVLQGLFAVPMKYARRWNYEHIWLIYSLAGMVVLPWMLTIATVPHLGEVYALTPMPVLVRIASFGLCWGIGSALAGLGMNLLGIGLGMAIIL
jgi:L-rhamnose-H+ transport protein